MNSKAVNDKHQPGRVVALRCFPFLIKIFPWKAPFRIFLLSRILPFLVGRDFDTPLKKLEILCFLNKYLLKFKLNLNDFEKLNSKIHWTFFLKVHIESFQTKAREILQQSIHTGDDDDDDGVPGELCFRFLSFVCWLLFTLNLISFALSYWFLCIFFFLFIEMMLVELVVSDLNCV